MMCSNDTELNKLKKSDLISIIKDLSSKSNGVQADNCEKLTSGINSEQEKQSDVFYDSVEVNNLQAGIKGGQPSYQEKLTLENEVMKTKIMYLERIVTQQEREIYLQQIVIDALKNKNDTPNDIFNPIDKLVKISLTDKIEQNKLISRPVDNASNSTPSGNAGYKADLTTSSQATSVCAPNIQRRVTQNVNKPKVNTAKSFTVEHNIESKNQRRVIIGTGKPENDFMGAPRNAWIYIGRVKSDITEEKVSKYLKSKHPNSAFICEKLPSKGPYAAFKIGIEFQLLETIMDPNFWPTNVTVRRFNFFRRSRITNSLK